MSTNEQTPLSQPTSAVRNTLGREQAPQNLVRPVSDEDLREYCDKNYHQILPIIAEKLHQENVQQEKLKAVKARLNFEEASQYSESETPNRRRNLKERLGPMDARTRSESPEQRRGRSKSPREKVRKEERCSKDWKNVCFIGWETRRRMCPHIQEAHNGSHTIVVAGTQKAATKVLALKKQKLLPRNTVTKESILEERKQCQKVKKVQGALDVKPKKQKSSMEDDLSQPWVCEETDPFTPRIRYFDFPKTRMPSHIKTYDESEDPEDHLKIFQAVAKTDGWAMPTWCHMFNSTLTENARQRNGESTEEFVRRYKLKCRDVKGGPKCMKIFGCMHGVTNPELIKRLHDKIPKSVDEMMSVTATFLRGEMAAFNREQKKSFPPWKQETGQKQNFKRGNFRNEQRMERKHDRFTLLTKTPREILALDKGKFKPLPPMTTSRKKECQQVLKFLLEIKNQLVPANTPLVGFSGEIIWPLGNISLLIRVGDEEHLTSAWMNFMVVRSPSPYNRIIRRPGVRKIRAIPSTTHGMIKFPVAGGIVTLQTSRIIPLECSMVSEPRVPRSAINQVREEKIQVAIHPEHPEQTVAIGSTLTEEGWKELCGLLRRHLDVFAWKPADMTGVPRHIVEHKLNVREGCLPVRQKKRGQAPERNKAISEEVKKLVEADIMKEVHYHSWLSNSVMVKKHDDSWRVCVDFKDLNKACPKDGYSLPKIDWKVESICGYPYKGFLDAYKGYHKIKMAEEDEEKTAFITSQGIFCYSKMPFGLKNARATYQRLCTKKSDFQWTSEAEGAFKEMKKSIAELSMLTAPKEKEELIMYLAATKEAISALLMTERDGKQMPVYFVSRALQGPEINYTLMEKLILALYQPRTSVKGQILAEFIVERSEDDAPDTPMEDREELPDACILFTDGSSCVDGSGAGLIIMNPEGMEFTYALSFRFNATINEVEYEALRAGLRIASQIGENKKADALSKITSTSFAHLSKQVLVEELREKAIDEKEIPVVVEEEGHTWMTPVYEYLMEGILPEEKKKARIVHHKAGRYAEKLTPITSPWPFYNWGIDIAGPFSEGLGKVKFLIVAIDYFTKWIEARPVITITGTQVKKFIWENIVCRFGLLGEIVSNNGKQFRDNPFKDWCEKLSIRQCFASVKHPQANGLVERANRSLGEGIKARAEEVIPTEIGMPTLRTAKVDMVKNNEALDISLDLLEEKREQVAIQEARNKAKIEGYYNARVRSTSFLPGDFVYQNNEASHAKDGGKLGPKWEGPYEVTKALGKGAYRLRDRNGHTLLQTWNICNLKK
nr:reverse transcriptase domain-containing protein [Tanacetum cinerariifolium]